MNHWDTVKKVRGIYKVTNKINGKVYIGQSVDIGRRWHEHMAAKDDIYFHKAIQKYGVENFEWEVIEKCKKKDLDEREIYWIEYYDSFNKGYNCTKGGEGVSDGEDHPRWKGGVSLDPEYSKQYYKENKEKINEKVKEYYKDNKDKAKKYYEAHKEELKEKQKEYNEVNKEKIKQYREANKEELKEKQKEYNEANKEKIKQYRKQYNEANKEKIKEYYETNKEKVKERQKEYYQAYKEQVKEKQKEYREANKEKRREYNRQYNKKSMKNTLFN